MCGIAGILHFNQSSIEYRDLKCMTDTLIHRGPDGEGQWINKHKNVGLGHRRLSIIDLSEAGVQPMHYADNRYTITFNGEIYNYIELKASLIKQGYSFKSDTDTEVLLALYDAKKESCLQDLDGMFAFAIWDEKEQQLFCGRDRFGEKPFYYYVDDGKFVFASEMKAIWVYGIGKQVNRKRLFDYLAYNQREDFRDTTSTFYQNINQLEASHYLLISPIKKEIKGNRYWTLNSKTNTSISLEEATGKFSLLFQESVKRRLRSDVPVGSSLSGGLDSSYVVSTIQKLKSNNQQQYTFSARYENFDLDEGEYMTAIINENNLKPFFTWPSEDTVINDIDKIFYHQEEPFGSSSVVAQWSVMKLASENGVKVLLDGQGADEILAGYHPYYLVYFSELMRKSPFLMLKEYNAYKMIKSGNTLEFKNIFMRAYFSKYINTLIKFKSKMLNYSQPHFQSLNANFLEENKKTHIPLATHNKLDDVLRFTIFKKGLGELLRKGDRNSMAFSVESRLPFLNHELVEFMFTLPNEYKIHNGWTKYILRKAMDKQVAAKVTWRKSKIGFATPQDSWFKNKQLIEAVNESKKTLYNNDILKDESSVSLNGWQCIMAAKLFEKW